MIGRFGRRILDVIVLGFALYAFCFVRLGKRTGLEHAKAVFTTPAALEAGRDLWRAGVRVHHKLVETVRQAIKHRDGRDERRSDLEKPPPR